MGIKASIYIYISRALRGWERGLNGETRYEQVKVWNSLAFTIFLPRLPLSLTCTPKLDKES